MGVKGGFWRLEGASVTKQRKRVVQANKMADAILALLVKSTVMTMFFLVMSVLWILTMLISFFQHPLKWSQLSAVRRTALLMMIVSPICTVASIPAMWVAYWLSYETFAWLFSFLSFGSLLALGSITVHIVMKDGGHQKQLF